MLSIDAKTVWEPKDRGENWLSVGENLGMALRTAASVRDDPYLTDAMLIENEFYLNNSR